MKSLVIAEKPSVARDIARVLKCNKNISGAIEGNQYIVTWALGHLVTLADPEGYDKKFKEWNMQVLPMMPKKMELVVIKKTAKQYNAVKTQMFRKDVGISSSPQMPDVKENLWQGGFWKKQIATSQSKDFGFLP